MRAPTWRLILSLINLSLAANFPLPPRLVDNSSPTKHSIEQLPKITHVKNGQFIDVQGLSHNFRGLNIVEKKFPYYPQYSSYHPQYSFSVEDAVLLRY